MSWVLAGLASLQSTPEGLDVGEEGGGGGIHEFSDSQMGTIEGLTGFHLVMGQMPDGSMHA